jgi:hypothetical protein
MSKLEGISCFAGIALMGAAAALIRNGGNLQNGSVRKRRSGREAPVEQLAERLKEAWAEHHTHA